MINSNYWFGTPEPSYNRPTPWCVSSPDEVTPDMVAAYLGAAGISPAPYADATKLSNAIKIAWRAHLMDTVVDRERDYVMLDNLIDFAKANRGTIGLALEFNPAIKPAAYVTFAEGKPGLVYGSHLYRPAEHGRWLCDKAVDVAKCYRVAPDVFAQKVPDAAMYFEKRDALSDPRTPVFIDADVAADAALIWSPWLSAENKNFRAIAVSFPDTACDTTAISDVWPCYTCNTESLFPVCIGRNAGIYITRNANRAELLVGWGAAVIGIGCKAQGMKARIEDATENMGRLSEEILSRVCDTAEVGRCSRR